MPNVVKQRRNHSRSIGSVNRRGRLADFRLFAEKLEQRLLLTSVVTVEPVANSYHAAASTDITAAFDQQIAAETVTDQTFVVHATQSRGQLVGAATSVVATGAMARHNAAMQFSPGELVHATVTSAIRSTSGEAVESRVWQFHTAVLSGSGEFTNGQSLGADSSFAVALGDVDADGDLDAFVANAYPGSQANRVWLNEDGLFSDSGQVLGDHNSISVALGDVDGDGDLDAFVANSAQGNRLWLNTNGRFADSGQILGNHDSFGVALGDLDGDGDLDAFVANVFQGNRVWLNNDGQFRDSGQTLGNHTSYGVALGDLDGDGDLDAFVANSINYGNRVWVNDGGKFTDSGQNLGDHDSLSVALGDLDADGDLDAVVGNYSQGNRVWNNDGGVFSEGQSLGKSNTLFGSVALGDLDGDGDLDVFTANSGQSDRVWINSDGQFVDSGQFLGSHASTGVSLGDLDNDGDLDAFVCNFLEANLVWLNENDPVGLGIAALTPTDSGFVAEFTADLDTSTLNLYNTGTAGLGEADLMLSGAISGPVAGSLVVDPLLRKVTFIKTGGPLTPDTYTATLRSGAEGFKDAGGLPLDGDGDGTAGDDFVDIFTITEQTAGTVVIGIPDFIRGPGQDVNLPADTTLGIPLSISDGTGVRNIELHVSYDPALLEITGATVGADMPPGAAVELNYGINPGLAIVTFSSPADLPAGGSTVVNLQATVPATDPNGIRGKQQVLGVDSVSLTDANSNTIPAIADDAVHLVSFFGDVSGNGRVNASDAAQVARIAALLDEGFAATPLTDPRVVGDISGNGRVNAADASLVARFAALIDVPQIPPIPAGVVTTGSAPTVQGPGLPGAATAAA